jgi:wobble nucleotide-excising tRNase
MSQTLIKIAEELQASDKKVQLIYAFNGSGKTRLSREFKELVSPKFPPETEGDEEANPSHPKILYYNAFTEDLFYWDNDLTKDVAPKLIIQPNSFTHWTLVEQGQDQNVIANFQHYTSDKLTPEFNEDFSEVTFSFERGNQEQENNIKLSKGEESNFIWSIFYTLLDQVVETLNIAEESDRDTNQFNDLKYVFIDDPVSSLDENHLIELAVNIASIIKHSESELKFIITTHNPLFYNVLHNELGKAKKYLLKKDEDGSHSLEDQKSDSPFAYHLYLKKELETAIQTGQIRKYHYNFLRNLLEKTSTFLGYEKWADLLPGVTSHPTH